LVIVLAVTLIPAVPYGLTIHYPFFPYKQQGYQACEIAFTKNNQVNFTDPAFQHCIAQYLIPPINVTGYGSLSFSLTGIGLRPFPDILTVGGNDFYAVLHMSGAKITAAELVPQRDVIYNPSGIVISNSSISQGFIPDIINMTITVTNRSGQTLTNPTLLIDAPSISGNYTKNGVYWILPSSGMIPITGSCSVNGVFQNLTSGASCTETFHTFISASLRSSYKYSVEVRGYLGSQYSITEQSFTHSISAQSLNQLWVNEFAKLVNANRSIPALIESPTLDKFAKLRFNTAVTQPDISDYGLYADESSFFGGSATRPALVEVLLYPTIATEDPYGYVNTIQEYAPGHWAALTDKGYTHFGYYVGSGQYEVVHQPCPVFEIPGAGINITQYFEKAGCSVSTQQSTWLVLILSN
jgi:hypothetical protein